METCLETQQPFVVDNTNPTIADREKYISLAKVYKFKVIGYYFQSKISEAIARNSQRPGKECIPEIGIKGTFSKLEIPSWDEGFDALYFVEIEGNNFTVMEWEHEI